MSLFDSLVRHSLALVPRPVIWTVARRYVAGSELSDALVAIERERSAGFGTIIDVLGEHVRDRSQAEAAAAEYHRALRGLEGVDPGCTVSVKPTHLGLLLDQGLCERLLGSLCEAAAQVGRRVRFEMEDAPTVDATLEVFTRLRPRYPNLGCVLQSRLFRSRVDAERLLAGGPGLDVRLVKGIYIEPPEIAWTEGADISASFLELTRLLVEGGAHVALATHDDDLADACLAVAAEHGLVQGDPATRRYEFQLLMGVKRPTAERLREAGHPVRIYVPYGKDWHAYSLRRLRKNPQVARNVLRALLRRG